MKTDQLPEIHLGRTSTRQQALQEREDLAWRQAGSLTVQDAIDSWLETLLNPNTRRSYKTAMRMLAEYGLIGPRMNIQAFALTNHDAIVDQIKMTLKWSELTRQSRCAAYISFTGFVARRSRLMKKAQPSKEGTNKTFKQIRDKVKTPAMSEKQWISFFSSLESYNPREALLGKLILQGGKRINEVLSAQIGAINWELREITYKQSKTTMIDKFITITYRKGIIADLKKYIGDRTDGHIFITKKGKPLQYNQVYRTFKIAGLRAGIPFPVTPHVMRASAVTYLKKNGFNDSDIMRITGHKSATMIGAYDQREDSDNISKKINLI